MKVYDMMIRKKKSDWATDTQLIDISLKERVIINEAMMEYCENHKRKKNAKQLLMDMDALFGYGVF